jgi:hypothetical protein
VEAQRDALSHQLEELFRVRNTEAEQLLEQQTLQYEARIQSGSPSFVFDTRLTESPAQEALIKELTSQAARVEPLTRSGKTSVLYLLTREAADEEKRIVERDLARLRDMMKEKDDVISQNDKRVSDLQQAGKQIHRYSSNRYLRMNFLVQDLRSELKAEIERSKMLAANASRKTPMLSQARSPGTILGNDSPKNTEVIKLYEDLTNLLVPNIKFTTGHWFQLPEVTFTCVYTFVPSPSEEEEMDDDDKGKSKRNGLIPDAMTQLILSST